MIERCSFLELRTADLALAHEFWVRQLGLSIIEEDPGHFFTVNAGGLRLCIDTVDDLAESEDDSMMFGFTVKSIGAAILQLASRGLRPPEPLRSGSGGSYVRLYDPDGRLVILTDGEEKRGPDDASEFETDSDDQPGDRDRMRRHGERDDGHGRGFDQGWTASSAPEVRRAPPHEEELP